MGSLKKIVQENRAIAQINKIIKIHGHKIELRLFCSDNRVVTISGTCSQCKYVYNFAFFRKHEVISGNCVTQLTSMLVDIIPDFKLNDKFKIINELVCEDSKFAVLV